MVDELRVFVFRHGPFWNFSYLLACSRSGAAAVIDPAWDIASICETAAREHLTVELALLTHTHSDHLNGLAELVERTGAATFVHASEVAHVPGGADLRLGLLRGGESLRLGEHSLEVLHTPGHSEGSVSFLVDGRLFCGDTLSVGAVGRPGPGIAAVEALWHSVQAIGRLPARTVIHPGHDEGPTATATVGEEHGAIAAWRCATLDDFVDELERTTGRVHRHE